MKQTVTNPIIDEFASQGLEELAEENRKLKIELADVKSKLALSTGSAEGFLITTPNPLYEGRVWGIRFQFGQAFIPAETVFEQFEVRITDKDLRKKLEYQYPDDPEQRKIEAIAIREREKIPSVEKMVQLLVNDFGYQSEYFSSDRRSELQAKMSGRILESEKALAAEASSMVAAQMMVPPNYSYLGM